MQKISIRKALFGYSRRGVEDAIAERDGQLANCMAAREYLQQSLKRAEARARSAETRIRELDAVARTLSDEVVAREREIADLRRHIAEPDADSPIRIYRTSATREEASAGGPEPGGSSEADQAASAPTGGLDRGLLIGADQKELFEADMTAVLARIESLHAQACAQATRIRMQAMRDAVDIAAETAGARLDREWNLPRAELEAAEAAEAAAAARFRDGSGDPDQARGHLYAGSVAVDIGPVNDFVQLARLEDAAGAITGAGDVEVEHFAEGRARLRMHLAEPVELLRELEQRSDLEFKISSADTSSVSLDLER